MFCTYCGNQISDDAKFCSHCGKAVNSEAVKQIDEQRDEDVICKLQKAKEILDEAYGHYAYAATLDDKIEDKRRIRPLRLLYLILFPFVFPSILFPGLMWIDMGRFSDGLICIVISAVMIYDLIRFLRRTKKLKAEREEVTHMGDAVLEKYATELAFLPNEYRSAEAVDYILNLFETNRVETLNQAYDKYDANRVPIVLTTAHE